MNRQKWLTLPTGEALREARPQWLRPGHLVQTVWGKAFVVSCGQDSVVVATMDGSAVLSIGDVKSDFSDFNSRSHAAMLWTRVGEGGSPWVPEAQDCEEEVVLMRMRSLDPTVSSGQAVRAIDWALENLPILEGEWTAPES